MQALIQKGPFADIRRALEVLERVACSIKFNEPVLLVGETGTGKTTLVQNLASWLKQPLTVVVRTSSYITYSRYLPPRNHLFIEFFYPHLVVSSMPLQKK